MSNKPKVEPIDYSMLAESVDALREILSVMVAGLMNDGFTEREARAIIAGALAVHEKNGPAA